MYIKENELKCKILMYSTCHFKNIWNGNLPLSQCIEEIYNLSFPLFIVKFSKVSSTFYLIENIHETNSYSNIYCKQLFKKKIIELFPNKQNIFGAQYCCLGRINLMQNV